MSNPAVNSATLDRTRASLLSSPERVDLDAIAQHFVKLAGGPGSIAKMLYDEYAAAGEGSPVRARIMEMMLRAFTKLDAKSVPDDLSTVSDEDLQRVLDATKARITGTPHGSQQPATSAAAAGPRGAKNTAEEAGKADATSGDRNTSDHRDPPDPPAQG